MKFKIDENLPEELTGLLKNEGYSAMTVVEQGLGGKKDANIIQVCQEESRSLISLDLDFSDIRTYPPQEYSGIILFRAPNHSKKVVLSLLKEILPLLKEEPLEGHLWIVEPGRVRIRGNEN